MPSHPLQTYRRQLARRLAVVATLVTTGAAVAAAGDARSTADKLEALDLDKVRETFRPPSQPGAAPPIPRMRIDGYEPSTNPNEPKPAPGPPLGANPGPLPKPAPGLGRNTQP